MEECFLLSVRPVGSPAFGISFVNSVAASVASLTLYLHDSLGHTIQHHSITIIIGVVAAYTVRIFRLRFCLACCRLASIFREAIVEVQSHHRIIV